MHAEFMLLLKSIQRVTQLHGPGKAAKQKKEYHDFNNEPLHTGVSLATNPPTSQGHKPPNFANSPYRLSFLLQYADKPPIKA